MTCELYYHAMMISDEEIFQKSEMAYDKGKKGGLEGEKAVKLYKSHRHVFNEKI